jgi:hypothetical protein
MEGSDRGLSPGDSGESAALLSALATLKQELGETLTSMFGDCSDGERAATLQALHHLEAAYQLLLI